MTHMMRNLELERLTLAAMSLGIARRSLQVMIKYANEREAFEDQFPIMDKYKIHIRKLCGIYGR